MKDEHLRPPQWLRDSFQSTEGAPAYGIENTKLTWKFTLDEHFRAGIIDPENPGGALLGPLNNTNTKLQYRFSRKGAPSFNIDDTVDVRQRYVRPDATDEWSWWVDILHGGTFWLHEGLFGEWMWEVELQNNLSAVSWILRAVVDTGTMTFYPTLYDSDAYGNEGYDRKTLAQRWVEAFESYYDNTIDQKAFEKIAFSIAGRSVSYASPLEMRKEYTHWKRIYNEETRKINMDVGLGSPKKIITRF